MRVIYRKLWVARFFVVITREKEKEYFKSSGETQSLCISAIRIISLSFVFDGCNIAFQGVFQALDSGLPSYVIWFTFLIAEGVSTIIALVFYKRVSSHRLP